MCTPMTYGRPVFSACGSSIFNDSLWYLAALRTEKRTRACAHCGSGTSSGRASDAACTEAAFLRMVEQELCSDDASEESGERVSHHDGKPGNGQRVGEKEQSQ